MAWPDDIAVLDANDVERAIKTPNPNGPADEADSAPVVLSTQDRGALEAILAGINTLADAQGAGSDVAYSGPDATAAAMLRAIADAAISQEPAVTKGAPVASYKSASVDETEDVVSAAPCTINDFFLYNPGSSTGYFHIYDADDLADVTVGTTDPIRTYPLGAGKAMHPTGLNIGLNNGLVVAATLGYTGNTAPQTEMVVNIGYRA